ncbi:MAG TPA: flagellar export protein FliJ [Solirubrobacterales bacterium]|nr:flagellar export protein FliJ [Solirubrobacterales bacterium]
MSDQVFRFRLERVHGLRRQAERSAQEALAASLGRQLESERALGELEATIEGARAAERDAATGAGERPLRSGSDLIAVNAYLERLAGNRAAAVRDLSERESDVAASRQGLLAAARERQALDRLRERRRAEHAREAARVEGAQLDELALAVHRRGRAA